MPTEGIHPNIVEDIKAIILRLNQEEALTIVLFQQNFLFARRACHVFVILEKVVSQRRGRGPISATISSFS